MSKTFMKIGVGITVHSVEHLPDGMDDVDVLDLVREVIRDALNEWYESGRGRDLLALEPEV